MNDMDYKPNSHKSKQETATSEEKRVHKVVSGNVTTKKRGGGSKLADMFIAEDAGTIGSYILSDVLIPAVKKAVVDIVTDGVNMLFFGGTGRKTSSSGSKISYASYFRDDKKSEAPRVRARFDYDDIVFDSRAEADKVCEEMCNVIERYGFVTVADMYDMAELSAPYTSQKYGWTNLRSAEVTRIREGYVIKLPKAQPID